MMACRDGSFVPRPMRLKIRMCYYQDQALADEEFSSEVKAGCAAVYSSRADAEMKVGALLPTYQSGRGGQDQGEQG
eukprot:6464818-Amphidinium_carterae.2